MEEHVGFNRQHINLWHLQALQLKALARNGDFVILLNTNKCSCKATKLRDNPRLTSVN